MIAQQQTRFGKDGNCLEACVASVLDLSIDDVPDFGKEKGWWSNFVAFITQFGVRPLDVDIRSDWTHDEVREWAREHFGADVLHLISGDSPSGLRHATVGRGGTIIHDPHPEGGGVSGDLTFTFFVVPDPIMLVPDD